MPHTTDVCAGLDDGDIESEFAELVEEITTGKPCTNDQDIEAFP